jgi:arginase family enzyme
MPDDPNWPRAGAWLAGDHDPDAAVRMTVVGAPLARGSLTPGRCDRAPAAIREALGRFSTFDIESGVDVRAVAAMDEGDVDLATATAEEALAPLAQAVEGSLGAGEAVVVLGGDNAVTRPALRGLGPTLDRIGLLTLDAHLDLRDTAGGLNNGNPVRALLEDGLPGDHVVQVGIAAFANSGVYAGVANDAGITVITADTARTRGVDAVVAGALEHLAERADTIYVDVDLDVLDRAFAPACPGSRPGGLHPTDLRRAARTAGGHPRVRAMDIVEVDPTRDVADVTVLTAASCLLSFAAGLAAR